MIQWIYLWKLMIKSINIILMELLNFMDYWNIEIIYGI